MSSRRARLPGAAELFRATGPDPLDDPYDVTLAGDPAAVRVVPDLPAAASTAAPPAPGTPAVAPRRGVRQTTPRRGHDGDRRPSGRERHEEKITVYVSSEELFQLEQARLVLRGTYGLAVDRGRIVREAVSLIVADLEAKGDTSTLVRRLRQG